MQIALQDIRRLGVLKLNNYFSSRIDENFMRQLKSLNQDLIGYKSSPFSIPKIWGTLNKDCLSDYSGIIQFMQTVEPTIDYDSYTEVSQRKFRNMWERWSKVVGKDLGMNDNGIRLISELGIRLIYYVSSGQLVDFDILEFYNSLLKWYIFTLQESNLQRQRITVVDLLETMVVKSDEDFYEFINFDLGGAFLCEEQ